MMPKTTSTKESSSSPPLEPADTLPALRKMTEDCDEESKVAVFREIARALSILCRGDPKPDFLAIEPALPFLSRLLSSEDTETVEEVCKALSYISAGGGNGIQTIIEAGVVSQLVELLRSTSTKILSPAIKTIANITKGNSNTSQIQLIMSHNVLPCLLELLDHVDEDIRKDVCIVMSNLTRAGDQIQAVIDAGIFPKLIKLMRSLEVDIQKEAVGTVHNTTSYGTPFQVWYLIDVGVIPALCSLLQVNNVDLVQVALEALERMLYVNVYENFGKLETIVKGICECDGMKTLQELRKHEDNKIFSCVNNIIELAFGTHLISDNAETALPVIQYYRKILGIGKNPPIQQVIDCGVVPCLIRFLQMDDRPDIQLEAAGAITNITFSISDHIRHVIEAGVVPILIRLLSSKNEDVRSEAAWALGNIAGDKDVKYRDIVLGGGALPALLQAAENSINKMIVYAICNLCDGRPPPDFEVTRPTLPLLRRSIYFDSEQVLLYSCRSLRCMAQSSARGLLAIIDEEPSIIPRLTDLLAGNTSTGILREVVKLLGSMALWYPFLIQDRIVKALPSFLWLLDHPDKRLRREVCETLANITLGTKEQIQAVIDAAIFPKLIELLESEDGVIQNQVAKAVYCVIAFGRPDQAWYLVKEGVVPPLFRILRVEDVEVVMNALLGLKTILQIGKETRTLHNILSDCDGMKVIKQLQEHNDDKISTFSKEILKDFL